MKKGKRSFSFDMIRGKRVRVTYNSGYVITGVPVQNYAGWFTLTDVKEVDMYSRPDTSVTLKNVKKIEFI